MQCMVGPNKDLKQYPLADWEPEELHQDCGDTFVLLSAADEMDCGILDTLKFT